MGTWQQFAQQQSKSRNWQLISLSRQPGKVAASSSISAHSCQNAGGNGTNISVLGGTKVRLLSTPATIQGIPLEANETQLVQLTTEAFEPMPRTMVVLGQSSEAGTKSHTQG